MTDQASTVLEADVTRHDALYTWLTLLIVGALLLIHISDDSSTMLGIVALISNLLLLKSKSKRLGWRALRFSQDQVAFGDTSLCLTRAQTSAWCRDPGGARLWGRRYSVTLHARPGDDERLAAALRLACGAPVQLVLRGSKEARMFAGLITGAGALIICFAFFTPSRVPTYIGIFTFFIGVAALLVLSSPRAIRTAAGPELPRGGRGSSA